MRSIKLFNAALWVAGAVSTPTVVDAQGQSMASSDGWFMQALGSTGADGRQLRQNAVDWFGMFARSPVRTYSDNGFLGNGGFNSFVTSRDQDPVINRSESESSVSNYSAGFVSSKTNVSLLTGYANGGGNVVDIAGTGSTGSAPEAAYKNASPKSFGLGYTRFFQDIAGNATTSAFAGRRVYGAHDESSIFVNNGNGVVYRTPVVGVTSEAFFKGDHDLSGFAQVTATPEPASLALMATGLFGLVPLIRRRRRRREH